ncbi:MAG: hypothetical protein OXD33_11545, partial [Rhodobacteraceae bacterium]|nr:hypothetical protein [Paracoccaceae bacterium]
MTGCNRSQGSISGKSELWYAQSSMPALSVTTQSHWLTDTRRKGRTQQPTGQTRDLHCVRIDLGNRDVRVS